MKNIIKHIKKNSGKALCIAMSIVMIFSLGFAGTMMFSEKNVLADEEKDEVNEAVSSITEAISKTNSALDIGDGSTIYVIQDATGTPAKVIVPSNGDFEEKDLASYTQPVDVKITYTLDGKEVTADEIAGKTGKVCIRFDYTNNEKTTAQVSGKDTELYVPYIALSGLILDDENFANISVTHGKAVDDGNRTVACGIALPGMKYNIDPDAKNEDVQKIPEYIEITADATDFSLAMTISLVVPLNLDDIDIESFDGLSDLGDDMDALVEAVDKIENGAGDLADGASELASGAKTLNDGMTTLDSGLDTLSDNSSSLREGSKTVFNSLISTVKSELEEAGLEVGDMTISNYASKLNAVIDSLDETKVYNQALEQVTQAVEAQRETIKTAVTSAVKAQVETNVKLAIRSQVESGMQGYPQEAIDAQVDIAISANLESQVSDQMNSDAIKNTISENTETKIQQLISENMASEEVQNKLSAASEGAKKVISAKKSLDSYNTFYLGLKSYTEGVDSASDGASKLVSGSKSLSEGATKVKDGASDLADGVKKFNDEGISKLKELFGDDLSDALARLSKVIEIGKETSSTKYVMRSAQIN